MSQEEHSLNQNNFFRFAFVLLDDWNASGVQPRSSNIPRNYRGAELAVPRDSGRIPSLSGDK